MFPNVDQPGLGLYLTLAAIWLMIFAIWGTRFPKLRLVFGDAIMFVVRHFALLFGWMFVFMVYFPIRLFNRYFPAVPYHRTKDESPKPRHIKLDLSKYKVSDYDFSQRFSTVFEDDEDDNTASQATDSDSDWVKLE